MLYKFKSKSTGELIMLEPNGRRILEIIGKTADPKGILLVAQMPAALSRLHAALAQEKVSLEAMRQEQKTSLPSISSASSDDKELPIVLRQRALPFIDMIECCLKDGNDVVWGV
jgi:cyclopropane-fatty-acyl-phospholipid synthase